MSVYQRNSYGDFVVCALEIVRMPPTKHAIIYVAASLMGREIAEVGLQLLRTIDKGLELGILDMRGQHLTINRTSTARFPDESVDAPGKTKHDEKCDDAPENPNKLD